jgi:hypothetical protein
MRRLLSFVLMLLLSAPTSLLAGVNINDSAELFNQQSVAGHFPMTVAGWINLASVATDGDGFVASGNFSGGVGGGFTFNATDTFNGCSGQIDFIKGGATDDFICSGVSLPLNAWVFLAAVVTSTQVRFVTITASGTLTGTNVADTTGWTAQGSPGVTVGSSSHISTNVFKCHCTLANISIYAAAALTDTELKALSRFGPRGISGPVTRFWPLYFENTTMGDFSGNSTNSLPTSLLINAGTPLNANHCPCADPWNEHE